MMMNLFILKNYEESGQRFIHIQSTFIFFPNPQFVKQAVSFYLDISRKKDFLISRKSSEDDKRFYLAKHVEVLMHSLHLVHFAFSSQFVRQVTKTKLKFKKYDESWSRFQHIYAIFNVFLVHNLLDNQFCFTCISLNSSEDEKLCYFQKLSANQTGMMMMW